MKLREQIDALRLAQSAVSSFGRHVVTDDRRIEYPDDEQTIEFTWTVGKASIRLEREGMTWQ
jgi:hypothetical protein